MECLATIFGMMTLRSLSDSRQHFFFCIRLKVFRFLNSKPQCVGPAGNDNGWMEGSCTGT